MQFSISLINILVKAGLRFILLIYWSVEHDLHVHKSTSSTQGYKTLTVACLNIKNMKQSTEH